MTYKRQQMNVAVWPAAGVAAVLFALLALLQPLDYRFYSGAARMWRSGAAQLYEPAIDQFYYMPWSLLWTAPLSLLPDRLGQAIFNLFSLAGLWWGTYLLGKPRGMAAWIVALVTPFTAGLLLLGQWDGLIVGGAAMAWYAISTFQPWLLGLAVVVITTKPTNALLLLALLCYAVRRWPLPALGKAALPPSLAVAASFVAAGPDWPLRYLAYVRASPPLGYNFSLWTLTDGPLAPLLLTGLTLAGLIWSIHRSGVRPLLIGGALVANMLISPFVVPYHLAAAAPALAAIAGRSLRAAALLWLLGLLAFIAFVPRWSVLPLMFYLLAVYLAVLAIAYREEAGEEGAAMALPPVVALGSGDSEG